MTARDGLWMEDGGWRMEDGGWRMEDGVEKPVHTSEYHFY